MKWGGDWINWKKDEECFQFFNLVFFFLFCFISCLESKMDKIMVK